MGKARVGVKLRESLGGNKSSNKSADLVKLTQNYQAFCKKIRVFISAIQQHYGSLVQLEKTRAYVAQQFGVMTKGTPLWESAGMMPSADRPAHTVNSYCSVHDNLSAKTKSYASKYQQFVLQYAVEWEKVVTTRIDAGLKKAEELRVDLDHYQKKVEALRLSANQAMAKGKNVKSEAAEKLQRNEEKLLSSKQVYNRVATDLCILMEEVTERSWRDLHPLLVKCCQFDMTLSADEAKILSGLNQVVGTLKDVASTNGLPAQARLKDLAGLKPELLSTRPGGVVGLTLENDGLPLSPNSATGSMSSPLSLAAPPGSVGPQGMGGFPVQIASDPSLGYPMQGRSDALTIGPGPASPMYRQNSYGSGSHYSAPPTMEPPSTLAMLAISNKSAPAPTLEDVYGSSNGISSAPPTGNLPPLRPSNSAMTSSYHGGQYRSSFNDGDSSHFSAYSAPGAYGGGAMAPAPSAPPPPPPPQQMPPDRSTSLPMYNAGGPPPLPGPNSMQSYSSFGGNNSAYGGPPPLGNGSSGGSAYGGPPPGMDPYGNPTNPWPQQQQQQQPPPQYNYSGPPANMNYNTNPFG